MLPFPRTQLSPPNLPFIEPVLIRFSGCITRKFRGYGFVLMMLQIPLVAVQRTPWVRNQQLFNNVCFWIFMILGLSLVSPPSSIDQTFPSTSLCPCSPWLRLDSRT